MVASPEELQSRTHPNFIGDEADLKRVLEVAVSPIRHPERGERLRRWSEWNKTMRPGEGPNPQIKMAPIEYVRKVDLRGANLDGICIGLMDLRRARLDGTSLRGAWLKAALLTQASLRDADLTDARLLRADLSGAMLDRAILESADLSEVNFTDASLRDANLSMADLRRAVLVRTDLRGATLTGCRVYGISTWDLHIDEHSERIRDLEITPTWEENPIRVDSLEVAQVIYTALGGAPLREVLEEMSARAVLLLGRFSPPERMNVLTLLRTALREEGFIPILFDFQRSSTRDLRESILVLAGFSRFIIADLTNPKSVSAELEAIIPNFLVPIVPIIQGSEPEYALFHSIDARHRASSGGPLMTTLEYDSVETLLRNLRTEIIEPALALSKQLNLRKSEAPIRKRLL